MGIGSFLIGYHVLLALLLPYYLMHYTPSWTLLLSVPITLYVGGLGITAGYHRYFSHRTYHTRPWVESAFLFCGSLAMQGSALKWSYDHRIHHAHVDTDRDPYSITKGFLYAHMLWLFEDGAEIEPRTVSDLVRNPRVMFQHKYSVPCMLAANGLMVLLFGYLSGDYFGAFVLTFLLRLFLLHHFTWFINSLAHTIGSKPFSEEQSAVDNWVLSLFTFGEGYHNYHHTYANDYRNGVRWYHFDPAKWLIWTLNRFGQADHLKRVSSYAIGKRRLQEMRDQLIDRINETVYIRRELAEQKVQELSEHLDQNLARMNQLSQRYHEWKEQHVARDQLKALKREMRAMHHSMRGDWERLGNMKKAIMRLRPLEAFN
ncbi:MAG: fatty acid desaturase [Chlamydiia bacterium]|nr:fatty acid desaturase [Chlamydiia bacterium]